MDNQGFDSELRTYYNDVKAEIKKEHSQYISAHPELREILNDFLSTVMLEKPNNVYDYAQQYFSYYNIDKDKILFKPLVIAGPSASGKGTLISALLEKLPQIVQKSISYTSRRPQKNETHGQEYFFVSKEEFEKEIKKQSFFEYCTISDNYYGTHKGKLESIIQSCKIAILEIEVQGARKIHKDHPDWNFIFLNTPSLEELEKRMVAKYQGIGELTEEQVKDRLKKAIQEIDESKKAGFFQLIINQDINLCVQEVIDFIKINYNNIDI